MPGPGGSESVFEIKKNRLSRRFFYRSCLAVIHRLLGPLSFRDGEATAEVAESTWLGFGGSKVMRIPGFSRHEASLIESQ